MPFVSKAQRRFMYAKHPEIAKRWEAHTPKGKKLPDHKAPAKPARGPADKAAADLLAKAAFVGGFLAGCRAHRLDAAAAAAAAEALAAACEKAAAAKQAAAKRADDAAQVGGLVKDTLVNLGTLGTIGLPAAAGLGLGLTAGHMRNQADTADLTALRRLAMARVYQRKADEMALRRQVGGMQAAEPGRYVVLS